MKKIVIGHSKGGVGKSTIAFNLAQCLKMQGEKVSIVDLDFQQTLYFVNALAENPILEIHQAESTSDLIKLLDTNTDDYLVIDIGGFDSDLNRIALSSADMIIIPISNSVTDVIGFKTFEAILGEIDIKGSIHLLLNNIHPLAKNFEEIKEAIKTLDYKSLLLNTVIRNRKVYRDSLARGQSVFYFKDEKAIKEIRGLRDELI